MKARYIIYFLLFASCSKSQVSQYTTTYVDNNFDTITVVLTVTATTKIDTSSIVSIRRYHPPITPPTSSTFVLDTIPYSAIDLIAPSRGANTFYTYTQAIALPDPNITAANQWSVDNETRFNWGALQTGNGVYNWADLDNQLNTSIDKGQKFAFRIVTIATTNNGAIQTGGAACAYPLYVHTQMQNENPKDWIVSGMWVPNWNSPSYLSAWEIFLQALAAHINSASYKSIPYKNVVSRFDICGFGNYGEWHNAGSGRGIEPAGTKATGASLIRIVAANVTAFPNIPLIGNVDMFYDENDAQLGYYVLTNGNAWGKIGFRNDHLGDHNTWVSEVTNTRSYNGLAFYPEYLKRWQYAPMVGEPINYTSAASAGGNCNFWDMENEIRQLHASQFNNQQGTGVTAACINTNYINSSKACGYRLQLNSGIYTVTTGGLTIGCNWSNIGIAPIYENWNVNFELRNGTTTVWSGKSTFNPRTLLPGRITVTDTYTGLPLGTYSLFVIIKDPNNYRKPLTLYNKNRGSDGSYLLTSLTIK